MSPLTQAPAAPLRPATNHSRAMGSGAWKRALKKLFFVDGSSRTHEEVEDGHLSMVALLDPRGTARFIKGVTALSTLWTLVSIFAAMGYLSASWHRCADCSRPMRGWLLVHSSLQVWQLPTRLALALFVSAAEEAGESICECVSSVTASPAWSASRLLAVVHFFWVILGTLWWAQEKELPS